MALLVSKLLWLSFLYLSRPGGTLVFPGSMNPTKSKECLYATRLRDGSAELQAEIVSEPLAQPFSGQTFENVSAAFSQRLEH